MPTRGRPARTPDPKLATRVRQHMTTRHLSLRAFAASLDVSPATLSRSLQKEAFSRELHAALIHELPPENVHAAADDLLREALHIIADAVTLSNRADELVRSALDRLGTTQ